MENKLSFYNTLTRKVEKFVPNVDGKVAMYTCGPYRISFCTYWQSAQLYYGGYSRKDITLYWL